MSYELMATEIAELRVALEHADRALEEEIEHRDRAYDALVDAHIALGGDGEWVAKLPPESPPTSGDLHKDVPELARQLHAHLAKVVAEERERCSRIAETMGAGWLRAAIRAAAPAKGE